MSSRPYVVGLTGGVGSGKSTVAERFRALGAGIVDTDAIAHDLTKPGGGAMQAIREQFGARYLRGDGSLDRSAMRQVVFSDAAAKAQLEAILHPLIRRIASDQVAALTAPYVLLVVPLLFEGKGYPELIERVLVVDCPETLQVSRVMQRSGLSEGQVRAIMAAQLPRQQRLARADDVIDNAGDVASLDAQVRELDQRYRALAARRVEL